MQQAIEPKDVRRWCNARRAEGGRIGFVPTMGYLHEGHLALFRRARQAADRLVASLFVNPKQFGPTEDFGRYPRDAGGDAKKCAAEGVDLLFVPGAEQMYPAGFETFVDVSTLGSGLCGADRPGHFRGVCTVVNKLLNIVGECVAVFGEKDYQQLVIIRRMVADLNLPVEIIGVPIVREADGLAMSSRNSHLSADQRRAATILHRALSQLREATSRPVHAESALSALRHTVAAEPLVRLDYLEAVDRDTLQPMRWITPGQTVVALAATVGATRLIDNTQF